MLQPPKSVFCTVAFLLLALVIIGGCRKKSTDTPIDGSHVKVKLLNKDCMGYIVAILDTRYSSWGQAEYAINGEVYNAAVSVIEGQQLLDNLVVNNEYYVDIQPVNSPRVHGACFRAPGPPQKLADIFSVY